MFSSLRDTDNATGGVVVIGTGALGSELASLLAQREISRVLLIDPGFLEERNLARSTFLARAFAHRRHVDAMPLKAPLLQAEAARRWALSWRSAATEIADVGLATLAQYDVLCCCTDSALSRVETARAARLLGLPMLDCGVFGDGIAQGRVTWFATQQSAACYLCGMSEDRRAQLLAYASSASLGCASAPHDIPMTGTRDAVQHTAQVAVDLLQRVSTGAPPEHSTAWKLAQDEASGEWSSNAVALPQSEGCPWHHSPPGPLVCLPWEEPLAETLQRYGRDTTQMMLQLQWPLCTRAVCQHCGTTTEPLHRVAWVRRRLHCSHCNRLGTLEPRACVSTVASQDRLAACTPRQLNLPQHHLYQLRHALTFSMPERSGNEPPS